MSPSIVVVGSLSLDFVFQVPRRPTKGETVKGYSFETFVGGKGNNQALAAAKAGASCAMVGKVGADSYGKLIKDELKAQNVDTSYLFEDKEAGTGLANIYVDPEGDNSIIIVPRANDRILKEDIDQAKPIIEGCKLVMLQLEIPMETVIYTAKLAKSLNKKVLLNPAPAPENVELEPELLKNVDYFVPNQTEAELVLGKMFSPEFTPEHALQKLAQVVGGVSVITLGEKGVCALDKDSQLHKIKAFKVAPVDTTAAGDAFLGSFAHSITSGKPLEQALISAAAGGALATTKRGAAPSLPTEQEIRSLISNGSYDSID